MPCSNSEDVACIHEQLRPNLFSSEIVKNLSTDFRKRWIRPGQKELRIFWKESQQAEGTVSGLAYCVDLGG